MASYTGGSKATSRIQALQSEREKAQEDLMRRKGTIAAASNEVISSATGNKFAARSETVEELLKSDTVGLVTHEDFTARRRYLERCAADEREKREAAQRVRDAESRRMRLKKANKAVLSFDDQDESDEDDSSDDGPKINVKKYTVEKRPQPSLVERSGSAPAEEVKRAEQPVVKKRKILKNPDVDTTFLPDRERDIAEQTERERLRQAWINDQEAIKNEVVKITCSYWDGTGHRRIIRCKKGTTIGRFLGIAQTEFKDLRNTSADALMFIKEDLIIPHHYSFYDFIVAKARGVSASFSTLDCGNQRVDAKRETDVTFCMLLLSL